MPVPVNTALPSASGIGQQGQPISWDVGSWTNSPDSYDQKLFRDGVLISGASSPYIPTISDVGHKLLVRIVANNVSGDSLPALTLIPRFAVYKSTVGGAPPTIILQNNTQEMTHFRVSPNGLYAAYTLFYNFDMGTPPIAIEDGANYTNTEVVVIQLSDGAIVGRVPHDPPYLNTNCPWLPDSSAILFHTTEPSLSSNGKSAIAKFLLSSGLTSTVYNPAYNCSDPHVSFGGKIAFGRGGGAANTINILSGGVETQLTTPTLFGFPGAGDTDPKWNSTGDKIACSRRVGVGLYRVVVVTLNPATNAFISELEIVPAGSTAAIDGTPEWSSDDQLIIWHVDPEDRASNGLYMMSATGTGRTRIPTPPNIFPSQPTFELTGGSGPTVPVYFSGQFLPIFPAKPVAIAIPRISAGAPLVGVAKMALPGTYFPNSVLTSAPTSYLRQWYVAGVKGTGLGSTTLSYIPVEADVGKALTFQEVPINSGGNGAPNVSLPSEYVILTPPAPPTVATLPACFPGYPPIFLNNED